MENPLEGGKKREGGSPSLEPYLEERSPPRKSLLRRGEGEGKKSFLELPEGGKKKKKKNIDPPPREGGLYFCGGEGKEGSAYQRKWPKKKRRNSNRRTAKHAAVREKRERKLRKPPAPCRQ